MTTNRLFTIECIHFIKAITHDSNRGYFGIYADTVNSLMAAIFRILSVTFFLKIL